MSSNRVAPNGLQLPEGGDFEAQNYQKAQTLIEAKSLILPLNRHFWVGAVMGWFSFYQMSIPYLLNLMQI
jgi:hypothetical protein